MRHRIIVLSLLLASVLPAIGGAQGVGGADRRRASGDAPSVVTERIDSIFLADGLGSGPGCAVGVYRAGHIEYARGYGEAVIGAQRPITAGTAFEAMSVSKQFTAAAIALLVQDGLVRLDDPVRRWLPELRAYPDAHGVLTVRHLVHHTSGIRDLSALFALAGRTPAPLTLAKIASVVGTQRGVEAPPGTRFAYDNTNYALLALVVERAAHEPLASFARRRLFEPLGMHDTRFGSPFDSSRPPTGVAVGHTARSTSAREPGDASGNARAPDVQYVPTVLPYEHVGPFGLLTTVEDLGRWERALVDGRIGNRATTALLQTPARLSDGTVLSYAFGLATEPYRGVRMVQHTGSGAGYRSTFMRFPDDGVALSVLCNRSTAQSYALATRVADVLLSARLAQRDSGARRANERTPPVSGATTAEVRTATTVPRELLDGMEGVYWNASLGKVRRVAVRDGQLSLFTGAVPVPMRPAGRTMDGAYTFVVIEAPQVGWEFSRTDATAYRARRVVRGETDEEYRQYPPWTPDSSALREFVGDYVSGELDVRWSVQLVDGQLQLRRPGYDPTVISAAVVDVFRATPLVMEAHRDARHAVDGFLVTVPGARRLEFVRCRASDCASNRTPPSKRSPSAIPRVSRSSDVRF